MAIATSSDERALTTRADGPRVLRFNRTERLVHWTQALTFLVLLASGLMISIAGLEQLVGHRAMLREIHLATAFFFVFGPAIIALSGNFASVMKDMREVDEWSSEDVRWLTNPSVNPRPWTPPPGRFNAGQKLNAIFTAYSTLAFGTTGLILWQNRRFPFAIVSQANTLHMWLAYIAALVFLGHLALSTVIPGTRRSFLGMVTGTVDHAWAAEHHPRWAPAEAREPGVRTASIAGGIALVVIGMEVALLAVRAGFEMLGANTTDPVTKMIYRFSGLPGTLHQASTAANMFDLGALIWLGLLLLLGIAVARRQLLLPRVGVLGQTTPGG